MLRAINMLEPPTGGEIRVDGENIMAKGYRLDKMRRKIARVGTKGTHDLELARLQTFERFKKEIAEALGRDVFAYIHKLFQNN